MTTWNFDRYVNGVLMAEGVTIEHAKSIEEASRKAVKLAARGTNGETPVLVFAVYESMRAALKNLASEVGGLRPFEDGVRGEVGNTNWSLLMQRLAEADAAVAKGEAQS